MPTVNCPRCGAACDLGEASCPSCGGYLGVARRMGQPQALCEFDGTRWLVYLLLAFAPMTGLFYYLGRAGP